MALVAFNRLQLLGSIDTGDIWSCTFNFATNAGESVASSEAELSAAAGRVRALNDGKIVDDNLLSFMSSGYSITGFKLSDVSGATFHETAQAAVQLAGPVAGTGSPVQAPEIAACCSFNLNSSNRRYRGRVFWPGVGRSVTNNFRYLRTDCDNLAAGMRQTLTNLAIAIDGAGDDAGGGQNPNSLLPCVVSKTGHLATPISQVSVGDVPDVQRRRRNKEQEAYSILPVP